MSFEMRCNHCGQQLEVENELIGQQAECPACNSLFIIKMPDKPGNPAIKEVSQAQSRNEETISKGKEMGKKAYDGAKEATGQAIRAVKTLIKDPIGGQLEALDNLGQINALKAGIVLIIVFTISSFLLGYSFIEGMLALAKSFGNRKTGVQVEVYLKLFIFSVIPSISIFLSYFSASKMLSPVRIGIPAMVFTAGISTLPLSILFFSIKLFGLKNAELLAVIGIFSFSTTILLINSSLQDIYKLPSRKSIFVTPAMLLLSAYFSKVIFVALLK